MVIGTKEVSEGIGEYQRVPKASTKGPIPYVNLIGQPVASVRPWGVGSEKKKILVVFEVHAVLFLRAKKKIVSNPNPLLKTGHKKSACT
jgi:hypothetical protein